MRRDGARFEQLRTLLEATGEVEFQPAGGNKGRYGHIQAVLKRFAYPRLKRANKGLVLRYLGHTTKAYSRQQVTGKVAAVASGRVPAPIHSLKA